MNKNKLAAALNKMAQYSLIVFVASLPISIALTQISLGLGWLFWLGSGLIQGKWQGMRTPMDISVLLLLSVFVLASVFSSNPGLSFWGLKKFYLTSVVYLLSFLVISGDTPRRLLNVFIISNVIAGLYGLLLYVLNKQSVLLGFQTMALTSSGIFAMAGVLSLGLTFSKGKNKTGKIFYSGCAFIIAISLLLTRSVSSWFSFVMGLLFVLATMKKYKMILLLAVLSVTIATLILGSNSIIFKNYNFKIYKTWSWTLRKNIWKTGWEIIKQKPILGHGNIDLGSEYAKVRKDVFGEAPENIRSYGHLHNNFLHIFAITGIVGLSIFCFMIYSIIKLSWSVINISTGNDRIMALSILGGIIVFLVNGFTEWNFGDSEVVTVFWFLTGLITVMKINRSGWLLAKNPYQ